MAIEAIFWDVGGVLLSNAWDHTERAAAAERFELDAKEFNTRHKELVSSFERGKITLDEYLDGAVFYRARSFSKKDFKEYMFSLSRPREDVLNLARTLAERGKYFMATINNESRELNIHRIEKFKLRKIFRLFVSSCFVGMRKPEADIYRLALDTTQISPENCCFIDDRAENLTTPAQLGMQTIEMTSAAILREELEKLGVFAEL